jgi:RHS repeat-associated protein
VLDTSHPYRSTSDPTYGFETLSYDGLDRPTKTKHQDGTVAKVYYGSTVTSVGGLATQQCGSCQAGYPTLTMDEAGKIRQVWTDAFGKTVEVDEPAANANTGGSGSATGSITFSGGPDQSVQVPYSCGQGTCYYTVYDGGTFQATVGGVGEGVTYNSSSTPSSLATALASAFNSDPASPVTATANGSVVTLTSIIDYDYGLGVVLLNWNSQYFSNPSFSASASGGALTGGTTPQMSAPTVTYYSYDPLGNLTQVSVVGSQECNRTYTYDTLSRMLSSTEPEPGNGTCTNSAHTTYYYYTASGGGLCSGNSASVCRRTDGRGITTTYTYNDPLNRPTGMSYSDGTTPTVTYSYDQTTYNNLTITNGKGRRTGMSDGSGTTAWSFDANGNILTEKRTIAGVTKTISYAYNGDNSLKKLTYPSGRVVNFTVGNAERTTSAIDGNGAQYVLAPSSGPMYAPTGALANAVYGKGTTLPNGLAESRSYNNRLQITAISASSSAGTALNLAYGYTSTGHTNNNGELLSITNNADNGRTQSFTYDDLSRIVTASSQATSGSDCWGQSFTIDNVANLTNITTTQCSGTSLSAAVNGNNQFTTGYTYDAAGNLTNDGLYTYTYNAENEMTTANGVTYTYDGNRMRVKKSSGTLYWRSARGNTIAETNSSGTNVNEYVFFAGRRVVQRDSSGNLYYYQADLGKSTKSITKVPASGSASICYDADFTPYGTEMAHTSTCTPNYKFTGYELDSETGLNYAFNRHYNPRMGRFMSADPLGIASASFSNPQSLNRYAYVLNNPLNFIDPRGLDCVSDNGDGTSSVYYGDCSDEAPNGVYVDCDGCLYNAAMAGNLTIGVDANGNGYALFDNGYIPLGDGWTVPITGDFTPSNQVILNQLGQQAPAAEGLIALLGVGPPAFAVGATCNYACLVWGAAALMGFNQVTDSAVDAPAHIDQPGYEGEPDNPGQGAAGSGSD